MTPDACPDYVPLLVRAGDSTIAPADLDRLERHMQSCAGCRAAMATQRLMHRALAKRERVDARAGFAARVINAIDAEARVSWWDRLDFRQWTWRVAPLTAGLAILAYAYGTGGASSPAATATDLADSTTSTAVSAALWTEDTAPEDVMSLMLFADPDAPLTDALKEIPQ